MRLLGKHQFAEHARGLDIPAFADPDHLFDEPGGIVGMFEDLVADHIIESIFFERELFAVGLDELLVRVNQDFPAAMGVVVRKLVGYHIGTKHRIVSGTDFEYLIPALDAEILASQWMTGYHRVSLMCVPANIGKNLRKK